MRIDDPGERAKLACYAPPMFRFDAIGGSIDAAIAVLEAALTVLIALAPIMSRRNPQPRAPRLEVDVACSGTNHAQSGQKRTLRRV